MKSMLDENCSRDTARMLCDFFGDRAPVLAIEKAIELRHQGREEVANEWDLVSKKALEMIDISGELI